MAWYADILYREVHRLNHLPYYKPHIPGLDSQASLSLFPLILFGRFGLFYLSVAMIVEIGSRRLARFPLFDEPKETYPRPYADTTPRAQYRCLSGSPT